VKVVSGVIQTPSAAAVTDLVSASTSGGVVIEAANGTDSMAFGVGNTANATAYGNISMNTTGKIVNMADPTSAQDAATKAYVDANSGGWLSDPATYKYYYDDFKGKTTAPYDNTGTGAGAGAAIGQEVVNISTGTTTTGGTNFNASIIVPTGKLGNLQYTSTSALSALSDGTNTYTFRAGVGDGATGGSVFQSDPTNGIYFRYTHGTNSGNLQAVCRAAGVETVINTSVAPVVYAYTTALSRALRFEVNAGATSVEFFIDGVSVGTTTTNIPSVYLTVTGYGIKKSAGTTAREALLYNQSLRSAR